MRAGSVHVGDFRNLARPYIAVTESFFCSPYSKDCRMLCSMFDGAPYSWKAPYSLETKTLPRDHELQDFQISTILGLCWGYAGVILGLYGVCIETVERQWKLLFRDDIGVILG